MANYIEIVSAEVDTLVALYTQMHGLEFGAPDPDLGQARVATRPDGVLIGIRAPLAAHEQPIMRTYVGVSDIEAATKRAVDAGAVVAYGPQKQGARGTFAILFAGGVQHGLWSGTA